MLNLRRFGNQLGFLFRRETYDKELNDELRFHLEMQVEENLRAGFSHREARRRALIDFGAVERSKEECREVRAIGWLETFWRDLRYGARILRRNPGFSLVVVMTLGVVIGANSTVFSVINSVLLRPLPFQDPERLVRIEDIKLEDPLTRRHGSMASLVVWKENCKSFEQMATADFWANEDTITDDGKPEVLSNHRVSPGLFSMLGVAPQVGRTFNQEDVDSGRDVILLSDELWHRRFDADPDIVGKIVSFDGHNSTIVGVMPPGFWVFPWHTWAKVDFWSTFNVFTAKPGDRSVVVARLKRDVGVEQAEDELNTFWQHFEQLDPENNRGWGTAVAPLRDRVLGREAGTLPLLFFAVGFVFLIACANIGSLMMARAASRQKEVAIRTSMGAGRGRIVRQLLTESSLLALLGGVLGIVWAFWGTKLFVALAAEHWSRLDQVGVDLRVLAFTLVVSLLAAVLFGLLPALHASRLDVQSALKHGGRRSSRGLRQRARRLMVVSEVALTLVLLAAAGLMIHSFLRLKWADPGYNPENLLAADFHLGGKKHFEEIGGDWPRHRITPEVERFYGELLEKVALIPGVKSAALGRKMWALRAQIRIGGSSSTVPVESPVPYVEVSPGYFQTMEIPILQGRAFRERDTGGTPWVAVVNEAFVKRYLPTEDRLGKSLFLDLEDYYNRRYFPEGRPREIVGIVGDVRRRGLWWDPQPVVYISTLQHPWEYPAGTDYAHRRRTLFVRTESGPLSLVPTIRKVVAAIDENQAPYDIESMQQFLNLSISIWRVLSRLLTFLSVMAILLVLTGVYGTLSYSVRARTHEIGVRRSLGASSGSIIRLVVKQGVGLTVAGLIVGVSAGYFLTGQIPYFFSWWGMRLVYGDNSIYPFAFALVSLLVLVVAAIACIIPARWATRVDPLEALRYE